MDTTTTRYDSADHDDASNAPSLAALLAARAEQLAENERENAQRSQLSRENDRLEVIDYTLAWMNAHVSPDLAAALRMLPACDESHFGEDDFTTAALILLDVAGAGVDPDAHPSDRDDGRWHIARRWTNYYGWQLCGPHGYTANLGEVYGDTPHIDDRILDALAAYPAWLAGAEERRREEERKQRAQQAREAKPRRYAYVEGINRDDEHPGVLTRGNRLSVRVQNPRAEDGLIEYTGTLDNFSVGWLLITTESERQRLIPVARVQDITPLASVEDDSAADLDTDPEGAA